MENIFLVTLTSVAALGAFFGLKLAIAAKVFHVEADPRVKKIEEVLPGANCGACGFTGCSNFAQAVVGENAGIAGCPVGGEETADSIAEIMGVDREDAGERQLARILCRGDCERAEERSLYAGITSCAGAELVAGGFKSCAYGCLGLGDCVRSCPFDALALDGNSHPVVDMDLCTGCGKCVEACPRDIISLKGEEGGQVYVACRSQDRGKIVRQICTVGCIGCGVCARECPFDAITVENNLAEIDDEKCRNCGICVEKCPTNAIIDEEEE